VGKGRIAGLASVCAVAAASLGAFFVFAPSAEAVTGSVSINSGGLASGVYDTNGKTVVVQPGDTITFTFGSFTAAALPVNNVASVDLTGFGATASISKSTSKSVTFNVARTVTFGWQARNALGSYVSPLNTAFVDVVSPSTPTPSDPGSSSSGGGPTGGSTSSSSGGSTGGGGGVPTSAHGSATNPNVHIPGPSDHGIPSTSRARSTTPGGTITFPTQSPSSAQPTTSVTTQVVVQADATRSSHKNRPIGLAIISILALAAVTGAYIYQYLGGFGALRGATAGGGSRTARRDDPPRRNGPTPGPRANNGD
jgi:hypothetical protein